LTATLARLVQIDSVNPDLVPGSPGEREAAEFVAAEMRSVGCDVRLTAASVPA
jgi:acetylornithine deacetylase